MKRSIHQRLPAYIAKASSSTAVPLALPAAPALSPAGFGAALDRALRFKKIAASIGVSVKDITSEKTVA
jgi:hypothetical protein